jgi:uncharacterized caspase-like protein
MLLALTLLPFPALADKRVALVIGNGAYKAQNLLTNPPSDARLIGQALTKARFETIETKIDLGIAEFRQALRRFQSQANGAEVALVYFAGHGIEANGANWLIPTDAELSEDRDLDYEAIKADLVLQALQGAHMRVLVLDACRDNPFGRNWRASVRSTSSGLAKIEADDVLVLFAAAPGRTASDGSSANSPFAEALAKRLPEPGLAIQLLGGNVRDDVLAATGGNQRPYVSASITGKPFFLVPAERPAAEVKHDTSSLDTLMAACVKEDVHPNRTEIAARLAKTLQEGQFEYGWRDVNRSSGKTEEFVYDIREASSIGDELRVRIDWQNGSLRLKVVTPLARGSRGIPGTELQGIWLQDNGFGSVQLQLSRTFEGSGMWGVRTGPLDSKIFLRRKQPSQVTIAAPLASAPKRCDGVEIAVGQSERRCLRPGAGKTDLGVPSQLASSSRAWTE